MERALYLLEPTSGAEVSQAPSLRWQALPEAAVYWVLLIDAGATELLVDQTVTETGLAVTESLELGRTYNWVVNALNTDGVILASLSSEFRVHAP